MCGSCRSLSRLVVVKLQSASSSTGHLESACPAFLQEKQAGWLEASVPEGQLPNACQLRAAFVPCSSLGREELALLRRASSEEVSRLLV